jgi:hypothetical protein
MACCSHTHIHKLVATHDCWHYLDNRMQEQEQDRMEGMEIFNGPRQPFAPFVPVTGPAPFEQQQAQVEQEQVQDLPDAPQEEGPEDVVLAASAQDLCADVSREAIQHFSGIQQPAPGQHPLARFLPLNAQGKPFLGQYRIVRDVLLHTKLVNMMEFDMLNLVQGSQTVRYNMQNQTRLMLAFSLFASDVRALSAIKWQVIHVPGLANIDDDARLKGRGIFVRAHTCSHTCSHIELGTRDVTCQER